MLALAWLLVVHGLQHPKFIESHHVCSKFLLCLFKQPKTQGTKVSRKTELVSIQVIVTLD
jgi:hypothetical protein